MKFNRSILIVWVIVFANALGCGGREGQPQQVVKRFYEAAMRNNAASVSSLVSSEMKDRVKEIIKIATEEGSLKEFQVVDMDVWSEHGAICSVKKEFNDGRSVLVKIDVNRRAGIWKVRSGMPSF